MYDKLLVLVEQLEKADKARDDDEEDGEPIDPGQWEEEEDGIWVYTDQKEFSIEEAWSLEFAETCSKPRLDEFGGGAVVCYKGEQYWMHTRQFVTNSIKELTS